MQSIVDYAFSLVRLEVADYQFKRKTKQIEYCFKYIVL